MNSSKKGFHYGFVIVAAVFIDLLVCGGIFFGASGVFIVPVTTALGIGQGEFSLYLTIQSITTAVGVLAAPKLLPKFGFQKLNAAAAVVAGGGFAIMGFAQNVVLLYAGGVMVGLGCVFLTYLIAGTLIPRWFREKQGMAIAIGMSGLGLGGVIFNPVISALVNGAPMFGFSESWRSAYIVLGAIVIIICLPVAMFIIRNSPEDKGLQPYGAEKQITESGARTVEGVSKSVAVKSISFILYCIMVFCFTLPGGIMSYLPALATSSEASAGISGIIGSVGMFGTIAGGFIIGWANDKFGAQFGGIVAGASGILGFVLMMIGANSSAIMLIGAACYGIFYQINTVQMPAMVTAMYGEREYDKIFPVGATVSPWVGAAAFSVWGFLYDATQSYNIMLIAGMVCCVLTAIMGVLAVATSKKLPRESVEITK